MASRPAKRARKDYSHFFKRSGSISVGERGFLATCNYQMDGCIRECYQILEHYADILYGIDTTLPSNTQNRNGSFDISDELLREVVTERQRLNNDQNARFIALDTGAINTTFIRSTIPDPVDLASFIVRDIFNDQTRKTRALIRLIPVEIVCSANNVQTILKAVDGILDKHFTRGNCTYSIVLNRRLNNSIDRDTIIRALAGAVYDKNTSHKVDLRFPQKTVVVEIIKGICMVAVVPYYFKYKKYNLLECGKKHESNDLYELEGRTGTEAERLVDEEHSFESSDNDSNNHDVNEEIENDKTNSQQHIEKHESPVLSEKSSKTTISASNDSNVIDSLDLPNDIVENDDEKDEDYRQEDDEEQVYYDEQEDYNDSEEDLRVENFEKQRQVNNNELSGEEETDGEEEGEEEVEGEEEAEEEVEVECEEEGEEEQEDEDEDYNESGENEENYSYEESVTVTNFGVEETNEQSGEDNSE